MRVCSDRPHSLHFAPYSPVVVNVVCHVLCQRLLWFLSFGDLAFCAANDSTGVRLAFRDTFECRAGGTFWTHGWATLCYLYCWQYSWYVFTCALAYSDDWYLPYFYRVR